MKIILQTQLAKQEAALVDFQKRMTDQIQLEGQVVRHMTEIEDLRKQLAERRQEADVLHRAVKQKDAVLRFLLSPQVQVVSLKGLEGFSGEAILLFDPQRRNGLFYAYELNPLPPGKTYQLWAVVDKPVSMGVLHLDKGPKGRLLIKDLPLFSQVSKFEVSQEPEGGVSQPTGDVHLLGGT